MPRGAARVRRRSPRDRAILAGAATFTAIAEWAHDLIPAVRVRARTWPQSAEESTIRRVVQAATLTAAKIVGETAGVSDSDLA